ncbi:peptidoglycan DD-metalloendopeptidase family protein [Microcella sp.]|uniref:peptidoglycan DD-metalloendopeptidase family protein n=1 Tax=Microcella sp. TaxID=1913979 RepID=UPI00255F2561|nr:peptidoglycan DD-metalloendopeptidase family protein [Microcella sp.]MBX9472440.1 peptidoglycan DD-metalloendopeptidase family protein [Microcella sp.]
MTNEFPWAAEGSDQNSPATANDALESLGFSFTEESSAQTPVETSSADVPTAALEQLPSGHSTDLVPLSRRALREAERSKPSSRRGRGPAASEPVAATSPSVSATETVTPTPVRRAPAAPPVAAAATRPASSRPSLRRRIAQKTFPPVVMLAAAALLVGTSVPATALFDPDAPPASTVMASIAMSDEAAIDPELTEEQVVEVEAGADLTAVVASRDEWSVTSYAEMLRLKYGSRDFSYSTSGSGAVRWPFPAAVPISSGFGERVAPCRYCSSYHQGLDFNPGAGTPIFAIADGVVIKAEHSGGFGNHAIIEHTINGQRVTSTYAHMTTASSPLVVGQQILVGDFVGTVGSTGTSTGAHLHFEIRIDDIAIDPFAWLQANAS